MQLREKLVNAKYNVAQERELIIDDKAEYGDQLDMLKEQVQEFRRALIEMTQINDELNKQLVEKQQLEESQKAQLSEFEVRENRIKELQEQIMCQKLKLTEDDVSAESFEREIDALNLKIGALESENGYLKEQIETTKQEQKEIQSPASSKRTPVLLPLTPQQQNNSIQTSPTPNKVEISYIMLSIESLKSNFEIYCKEIPHEEIYKEDIDEIFDFVLEEFEENQSNLSELLNCKALDPDVVMKNWDFDSEEKIFKFLKVLIQENNIGQKLESIKEEDTNIAEMLACDAFLAKMLGFEVCRGENLIMPNIVMHAEDEDITISGW